MGIKSFAVNKFETIYLLGGRHWYSIILFCTKEYKKNEIKDLKMPVQ